LAGSQHNVRTLGGQQLNDVGRERNGVITQSADSLFQQALRATKEMEAIAAAFRKRSLDLPDDPYSPLGSVTVGVRDLTARHAQLVGAPLGLRTREWFSFGETSSMPFSVEAKDGVGIAKPLVFCP
jgi:hypothetical protein